MAHARTESTVDRQRYLTFFMAGEEYGIHILNVQEIIRAVPITPVPQTPAYVLGVTNLRGQVVPVIDLRQRLGLAEGVTPEACIIIVRAASTLVGVLIDRMNEVIDLPLSEQEPTPDFGAATDRSFVSSVAKHENRLILLLDIEQVTAVGGAQTPTTQAVGRTVHPVWRAVA